MEKCQDLEISMFYESEVPSQEQEKVNSSISKPTETGGAINYARCARVLRRLDLCPGVITASNMSTTQNTATASSICNTREPLWAEDFIDLSEFCQPSTIPTKMEDLADEHVTSPISSTVRDHGLDYALEVNDGFDNNIEDNLWCIGGSPLTLQEELCDPISDWLSATKETNVYDNLSTRSEIYNINDTLLSPTFTQVPTKIPPHYDRTKELDFADNKMPSPPLQPDTTFFHTDSTSMFGDVGSRNPTLSQNLFHRPENSLQLTNTNSIFAEKLADTTYTTFAPQNARFFDTEKPEVPVLSRVTVDTTVSSPCSVQSPSITQSNLKQEEKTNGSGITGRRNVKLKLKVDEPPSASSSCTLDTPEMLQPLVNKNSEFDLVSYVFDDSNKAPMPFDISNLQNASNTIRDATVKVTPLHIKSEPKEDSYAEEETSSTSKRSYDGEEKYYPSKRSRRFSNTSSLDLDDLTQLESEKYRELRNRNNEASRRSRANRKSREVEMKDHASHLESENRRLKVKAEEMEQLVKRLRSCLMQLVLKRR